MWYWIISSVLAETLIVSADLNQEKVTQLTAECTPIMSQFKTLELRSSRFFVKGSGFQYRVVIAGFSDDKQVRTVYDSLADVSTPFFIEIDGQRQADPVEEEASVRLNPARKNDKQDASKTATNSVKDATTTTVEKVNTSSESEKRRFKDRLLPTASDVLIHAANAHSAIQTEWSNKDSEIFFFYRELPQDGAIIYHEFYKNKEAMRLNITQEKGQGINSTTVVPYEGEGWVQTAEKTVARNAIRTKELLLRFASMNILSVPYNIATDINSNSDWQNLSHVEDEGDIWALFSDNDTGLVEASFHKSSWLLNHMTVQLDDRRLEYEFQDYRQVEGLGTIPHVIQIYDDEVLVEEIRIMKIDVISPVDSKLFVK